MSLSNNLVTSKHNGMVCCVLSMSLSDNLITSTMVSSVFFSMVSNATCIIIKNKINGASLIRIYTFNYI